MEKPWMVEPYGVTHLDRGDGKPLCSQGNRGKNPRPKNTTTDPNNVECFYCKRLTQTKGD